MNAILDDVTRVSGTARDAADGADAGVRSALDWLFRRFHSVAES